MLMIAITGRSGSGKSLVAQHYAKKGYPSVDGDQVSRKVCSPGSPCVCALAEAFGLEILGAGQTLLRRRLADIAFENAAQTRKLEQITHPYIMEEIHRLAALAKQEGHRLFFMEGAAIVGHSFEKEFDKMIVVSSESKLSVSRIILRDGISKTSAHRRLDAQPPQRVLDAAADYVIHNDGSVETLLLQADKVLEQLLQGV